MDSIDGVAEKIPPGRRSIVGMHREANTLAPAQALVDLGNRRLRPFERRPADPAQGMHLVGQRHEILQVLWQGRQVLKPVAPCA